MLPALLMPLKPKSPSLNVKLVAAAAADMLPMAHPALLVPLACPVAMDTLDKLVNPVNPDLLAHQQANPTGAKPATPAHLVPLETTVPLVPPANPVNLVLLASVADVAQLAQLVLLVLLVLPVNLVNPVNPANPVNSKKAVLWMDPQAQLVNPANLETMDNPVNLVIPVVLACLDLKASLVLLVNPDTLATLVPLVNLVAKAVMESAAIAHHHVLLLDIKP